HPDAPRREREEPRQAVERRRLPATGRSEQGDELTLPDGQVEVLQGIGVAEATPDPGQTQLLEACIRHFATFDPPICSSHILNALTRALASSGSSFGLSSMSASYSGRPNFWMASWLSAGAMEMSTSFTAGPG